MTNYPGNKACRIKATMVKPNRFLIDKIIAQPLSMQ